MDDVTISALQPSHAIEITKLLDSSPNDGAGAGAQLHSNWSIGSVRAELTHACALGIWRQQRLEAVVFYRKVPGAWEITQLATHLKARRQGLMERLLRHLLTLRPHENQLWLEVHAANDPARRLYEKLGFKVVGERPRYYPDGGAAILYSLG